MVAAEAGETEPFARLLADGPLVSAAGLAESGMSLPVRSANGDVRAALLGQRPATARSERPLEGGGALRAAEEQVARSVYRFFSYPAMVQATRLPQRMSVSRLPDPLVVSAMEQVMNSDRTGAGVTATPTSGTQSGKNLSSGQRSLVIGNPTTFAYRSAASNHTDAAGGMLASRVLLPALAPSAPSKTRPSSEIAGPTEPSLMSVGAGPAGGQRGDSRSGNTSALGASQDKSPRSTDQQVQGDVFLDGVQVGRWMSRMLKREAERASVGRTGFDGRRGLLLPGPTVGSQ